MPRVSDSAVSKDRSRLIAALHIAFPVSRHGRHTEVVISELHTWPVCTPVNASPASFRTQSHDSEPKWCATPFLCGSLIRYSMPVYPGASLITLSARTSTFGGIVMPICFGALHPLRRHRLSSPPARKPPTIEKVKVVLQKHLWYTNQ